MACSRRDPRLPLLRRLRAAGADEAALERARRLPLLWLKEMVDAFWPRPVE